MQSTNPNIIIQTEQRSLNDVIEDFKRALFNRDIKQIRQKWNENLALQAWFTASPVDFAIPGSREKDVRVISMDELIKYFIIILSTRNKDIIQSIWNKNILLRAWFRGERVDFSNPQDVLHEDWRILAVNELIKHFTIALSSYSKEVIEAIWHENKKLYDAINTLSFSAAKKLLLSVMNAYGNSEFIKKYLQSLFDAKLIQSALDEIKNNCKSEDKSGYIRNKIKLLEERLHVLNDLAGQEEITTNIIPNVGKNIPTVNSASTIQPNSIPHAKKRKITTEEAKGLAKKRKLAVDYFSFSDVIKQLPTDLNGYYHFSVNESMSLALKSLPIQLKKELTIKANRKTTIDSVYQINVSNPKKYQDFLNSYFLSLDKLQQNTSSLLPSEHEQSPSLQITTSTVEQQPNSSPTLFGFEYEDYGLSLLKTPQDDDTLSNLYTPIQLN